MYELAISNLCLKEYDLSILQNIGIKNIEIAPTKYFGSWNITKERPIEKVTALQSIFYNTNLNCFENLDGFLQHLVKVRQICEYFESNYVVFGSPKNRKAESTNYHTQFNQILTKMNDILGENIKIGLELNPSEYSCNVFCNLDDIEKINFNKNLLFHFDVGCISYLSENPEQIYDKYKNIIEYIHVSEKSLARFDNKNTIHDNFSLAIQDFCGIVSLESVVEDVEQITDFYNKYKHKENK